MKNIVRSLTWIPIIVLLFVLFQNGSAWAGPGSSPTFSIPLSINQNGLWSYALNFGVHPNATSGIDIALGEEEYPPFPPGGGTAMLTTPGGNALLDLRSYTSPSQVDVYQVGIALDETDTSWAFPIVYSWPNLNPYYSGSVRLKCDINGSVFDVDMKAQTSYTLDHYPFPSLQWVMYVYIVAEGPIPGASLPIVSTYGVGYGGFRAMLASPAGLGVDAIPLDEPDNLRPLGQDGLQRRAVAVVELRLPHVVDVAVRPNP